MTDRLPWFPFYPSDFLTDERVMLMTMEERGAYITLLCLNWREGSIPTDLGALSRMLHLDPDRTKDVWGVVGQCFKPSLSPASGRVSNARLDRIKVDQQAIHDKRVEAGRKGGKALPPKELEPTSQAQAPLKPGSSNQNQIQNQSQIQKEEDTKTPPTPRKRVECDPAFEVWWKSYPRKVSRLAAEKAYRSARKRGVTSEALLENLASWLPKWTDTEQQYIPHGSTWLNDGNGDAPPEAEKAPSRRPMDRAAAATAQEQEILQMRRERLLEAKEGNGNV